MRPTAEQTHPYSDRPAATLQCDNPHALALGFGAGGLLGQPTQSPQQGCCTHTHRHSTRPPARSLLLRSGVRPTSALPFSFFPSLLPG